MSAQKEYMVRYGKWGAYIWRRVGDEDLPLKRVEDILNDLTEQLTITTQVGNSLAKQLDDAVRAGDT